MAFGTVNMGQWKSPEESDVLQPSIQIFSEPPEKREEAFKPLNSPRFGIKNDTFTENAQKPAYTSQLTSGFISFDSPDDSSDASSHILLDSSANNDNILTAHQNQKPFSGSGAIAPIILSEINNTVKIARSRPMSASYYDSYTPISEDGTPIKVPISNTPRSRNSLGFILKSTYLPAASNALAPPSQHQGYIPNSRSSSPTRSRHSYRSKSPVRRSSSPSKSNPFNFKTQEMMSNNDSNSSLNVIKPAHRKGHKYKHSSVSMNLFQEPILDFERNKQLLEIPDLFPIPNFKESLASIDSKQKLKLCWSLVHFCLAITIFVLGFQFKLSAFSTLAHLIFYDSLGTVLVVIVDIMSNFQVWNNSSIVYPFGLGRLEVLVGFGLSASLIMVGLDLLNHFVEEYIVTLMATDVDHALSHHIHGEQGYTNWFIYEFMLIVSIVITLISSNFILVSDKVRVVDSDIRSKKGSPSNETTSRISKKNMFEIFHKYVYAWAKNPTHLITISYAAYLLLYPLISKFTGTDDLNDLASLIAASLLCYSGWRLVTALGGILLCAYPYNEHDYQNIKSIIKDQIHELDFFKPSYKINKFFITKFNYKLFVVGLQINMIGATSDDDSRIRFEIYRIVKREIEAISMVTYNSDLEITIDVTRV